MARASPFSLQLASAIAAADKLRAQLVQWRVHRHAPLELEPATVSEIRSFKYPPSCVVTVMAAVHRLLGYRRRDVAVSFWCVAGGVAGFWGFFFFAARPFFFFYFWLW